MIAEVLEKLYTVEEYFKQEERANYKSEFRNGKIVPKLRDAGGSFAHNKIGLNIAVALSNILKDDLYDVINSDHAIHIPKPNHFVYADVSVVKGEPQLYNDGNQGILNPTVIFEVASDSTEKYDRYGKFKKYKTIPTFQEYVLVEQDVPIVEVYLKNKDVWQSSTYIGLEETVLLQSINCSLKMTDIYKKIKGLLNPQTIMDL